MKGKIVVLIVGIALGFAAAVWMPRSWRGLVPSSWKGAPTEGTVEAKRWEDDRLLLTLVTPEGAVLATFSQRVDAIDLLVDTGDSVSLALSGYRPFVDDPEIVRVAKAKPHPEPPPPAPPAIEPPAELEESAPQRSDPEEPV